MVGHSEGRPLIRAARVAGLSLAAILALAGPAARADVSARSCPNSELRPTPETLPRVEAALLCLMNAERSEADQGALAAHPGLEASALDHTLDMTTRGYFGHYKSGRPPLFERIKATGYFDGTRTGLFSENLGFGPPEYATAIGLHAAFMYSEAHRRNIMFGKFREVGIAGIVIAPNPAFYAEHDAVVYSVDFGRRYVRRPRPKRCRKRRLRAAQEQTESTEAPRKAVKPRRYCRKRKRSS